MYKTYAYYVNKLRQNVGLETWLWRQIETSQAAHAKYKWPPYATEWIPAWKFSAYATDMGYRALLGIGNKSIAYIKL